jgi:gliding motility-associated-like protein
MNRPILKFFTCKRKFINQLLLPSKFLLALFLFGLNAFVYSQPNSLCSSAAPFCTEDTVTFPAGVGQPNSQVGPDYGCLGSQPNPTWFSMQIGSSGPVSIAMGSNNDIDFICWGPFSSLSGACNSLTAGNTVDCSYSGSPTETCVIANALAGEIYLLLITNFSGQVQNITFNQSNANSPGAGETNCPIRCSVTASSPVVICPGGTGALSANTSTSVVSYTWAGPGGFSTTTVLTPTIANILTNSIYTIQGVTSTGNFCTATTEVTVIPFPSYSVTPLTTTVCQGVPFIANTIIGNPADYSYQWITPIGLTASSPNGSGSLITPAPIGTATALLIYTVVVTPNILNCPTTTTMSVRINNPPIPILSVPGPLCNTSSITSATASPSGGTWYGNQIVLPNGVINPALATVFGIFPVTYSTSIGACTATNQINISISQFNTAFLTGSIPNKCVQDAPFSLMGIVQNTMGYWAGTAVSSGSIFTPTSLLTGTYTLTYYNPSTPNPNVCPASSTINVAVFNPPIPVISPILPKCTNAVPITLNASPAGGVWSGNTGVSPLGVYTPANSFNTAGTNTVIYTAGLGTCVASSSTTFHVSQFNSAALSTNVLNLCFNSPAANLMSLVTNTATGVWLGGNVSGTYSFNPSGLPTNTYVVSYNTTSFPNVTLCPQSSILNVSVLNPIQPIISTVAPHCSADAPFQLSVSPASGSFITSPYLSATGVFNPAMAAIGNNTVQYLNGNSSCNVIDTKVVNIEAFVPATITGTIAEQCITSPGVNLLPLTANASGIWTGPGVQGVGFNPANSGVGSIVLTYYTASSPSGLCPDQKSIAVNVYSLALPSITQEGPYCNSHPPLNLKVVPLGGVFGSTSTNAVTATGLFNPAYSVIGDNLINYSVTAGPCVAYTQTIIKIEKFISADFSEILRPFCKNDAQYDLNNIVQNKGGNWGGVSLVGSMFNPAEANIGNNNLVTYYTHSLPTSDLCPDTSLLRIRVWDIPQVSVVSDLTRGCAPVEVRFNTPSANTGIGEWTLGDGSETAIGLTTSHTYTAAGTYSVVFNYRVRVEEGVQCATQATLNTPITVFEVPRPAFSYNPYDEVTIANPQVQFTNLTPDLGRNTYQWQIDNLYALNDVNPLVIFPKTGQYRISLTATSVNGCKKDVEDILSVKPDFNVFIPSSFTPNFDGLNDEFKPVFSPYGIDTKTYELEVFDRWGSSLFMSKDLAKGWDGTLQNKGVELMKQEVYVYKLKYKDIEGKVYNKLGYFTLTR